MAWKTLRNQTFYEGLITVSVRWILLDINELEAAPAVDNDEQALSHLVKAVYLELDQSFQGNVFVMYESLAPLKRVVIVQLNDVVPRYEQTRFSLPCHVDKSQLNVGQPPSESWILWSCYSANNFRLAALKEHKTEDKIIAA